MSTLATRSPQVQFRTFDGLRIRYADSGGSQERTVLLTSPWPESVYAFTRIWSELAQHARLFAVDLPGFGASEGREDLFSPRAMGRFLAELVLDVGLAEPHIVAPDVGDLGSPVRRGRTPGADRERDRRHRRSRGADPAGRAARLLGARPRP